MKLSAPLLTFFLLLTYMVGYSQPPQEIIDYVIQEVNIVRSKGVKCGKQKMPPVGPIKWDDRLYYSARSHAKEMEKHNYFGHISIKGQDIGERLDQFDYFWRNSGENLGEGQVSFDEVLRDWIKSPSHCTTLMNPKMEDMGVAKYGKYWVQHFGRLMPAGHRRINETYSESRQK